jgi:hypothetical protein
MRIEFDKEEVARWFIDNYECWWCGKNGWDAGHHILGGKYGSLLNFAPLHNYQCHVDIHPILKKEENKKMLLQKTVSYLLAKGYEFNEVDKVFLVKNQEYYQK